MKYIIEIKPEYEDKFKGVMILGAENSNLYVDSNTVDELEVLNSDYINKHFGGLQDTAYQKGFEDGKKEAESSEVIEQAKVDAFNKGMLHKGEKIHDAYQRGLHEGNDIGYKDGFEDGKAVNDKGCEGCKYEGSLQGSSPCCNCSNYYKNNWTAKADKIGVGDVVETKSGTIFAVIKITADGLVVGFTGDGSICCFNITKLTKTGGHYNINEILGGLSDD